MSATRENEKKWAKKKFGTQTKNPALAGWRDGTWAGTRLMNLLTKNQEITGFEGWGSGCTGAVDSGLRCSQSWKQVQTLKDCVCCPIQCVHSKRPWHVIVTAFCMVSDRQSRYPRWRAQKLRICRIVVSQLISLLRISQRFREPNRTFAWCAFP